MKFHLHHLRDERGEVSKMVIILIVVIIIIGLIAYGVTLFVGSRKAENNAPNNDQSSDQVVEPPPAVYDATVGDTRFILLAAENIGNFIKSPNAYDPDLITTERFIRVTVGAQNKGKNNTTQYNWDIGNMVDSEGRNFADINNRLYNILPKPDLCGAILKPEFSPVPCVKYYEVSRASQGLKVVVKVKDKKQEAMLDLIFN